MERNYTVSTQINRPVSEVFSAVIDRHVMEKYFTTRSSASLIEGVLATNTIHHSPEHRSHIVLPIVSGR